MTFSDIRSEILPHLKSLSLTSADQINLDVMPYKNISIKGPGFGGEEDANFPHTNVYYLKYGGEDGAYKQILKGETLDGIGIMVRFGLSFESGQYAQYLDTKQT